MSRLSLVVVLGGLALFVAGCGGAGAPTTSEYQEAVVSSRDRADFALARITRARSMDELLVRMDEAEALIDTAAGDLAEMGSPTGLADDHEKLVDSLHDLAGDIGLTADQARQPGFENLLVSANGLSFESWDKVNRALARLDRAGIQVELLQRH